METLRFWHDEVQDRVVDCLRGKSEPSGLGAEDYDVIGFKSPFEAWMVLKLIDSPGCIFFERRQVASA